MKCSRKVIKHINPGGGCGEPMASILQSMKSVSVASQTCYWKMLQEAILNPNSSMVAYAPKEKGHKCPAFCTWSLFSLCEFSDFVGFLPNLRSVSYLCFLFCRFKYLPSLTEVIDSLCFPLQLFHGSNLHKPIYCVGKLPKFHQTCDCLLPAQQFCEWLWEVWGNFHVDLERLHPC